MISTDSAVQQMFSAVIPDMNGAIGDIISVMLVVISFAVIFLAYFYIQSLLSFRYEDGVLKIEKRDLEEEGFDEDRKEYNWLNQNDEKSDPFIREVGKAKQRKLVRKWSR